MKDIDLNKTDLVTQALLFDYYGELLTLQQQKIYREVFFDDYSLSEVAEDEKISRQGVHDTIKRTQKLLSDYEEKLGMVKKHLELNSYAGQIETLLKKTCLDEASTLEITDICNKIREY